MDRVITASAALLVVGLSVQSPPSFAEQMSESEKRIYIYGLHLGWAAAECNLYEQGKIATPIINSTFTRIGRDRDLSDSAKSSIYTFIERSEEFSKCQRAFENWKTSQ